MATRYHRRRLADRAVARGQGGDLLLHLILVQLVLELAHASAELLVLALALTTYASLGGSWGWLAALFFAPDVVLLGYLVSPRVGAAFYNAGHSYLGPALVAGIAFAFGAPTWALLGALIWVGHIGFDRMLGYGLKHATSFFDTHLGRVGKR